MCWSSVPSDGCAETNLLGNYNKVIFMMAILFCREIKSMLIRSFHKHKHSLSKKELELRGPELQTPMTATRYQLAARLLH